MNATLASSKAIFSTEVRLALEVQGHSYPVSAVDSERFVLVQPRLLEACDAELIVTINGQPRRSPIRVDAQPEPTREYTYSRQ